MNIREWLQKNIFAIIAPKSIKIKPPLTSSKTKNHLIEKKEVNTDCKVYDFNELFPEWGEILPYNLTQSNIDNKNIAYFKDGTLYDVYPRNINITLDEDRQSAYTARFLIINNEQYDLYNPKSITSIPSYTPDIAAGSFPYITRDLSNIIKMRATSTYNKELAIPLVFKAVELMINSTIGWTNKDYKRLISQLEGLGANDYADYLKIKIEEYLLSSQKKKLNAKITAFNNPNNYDYVEIPYLGCACPKCVIYHNRIYCISGKDKRFPKLPNFIKETGTIHEGCKHSFFLTHYYDGYKMDKYIFKDDGTVDTIRIDAIELSNRPFIDDRSSIEKQIYKNYLITKQKQAEYDAENANGLKKYLARRADYEWICENLPEIAPKSMSAYTRAKNSQTPKYLEIVKRAAEKGKNIT